MSVAVSPDGKWDCVSSSADHTVRIWDAATANTVISEPLNGHTRSYLLLFFIFHLMTKKIASGSTRPDQYVSGCNDR